MSYQAMHADGVGGAEIAAVVGLDPYRSARDVWEEKTGQVEPREVSSWHIDRGVYCEPGLLRWASARTGLEFVKNDEPIRRGPFIVRPDGVAADTHGPVAAEIKFPSDWTALDWGEDGSGSAGVPDRHLPQMIVEGAVLRPDDAPDACTYGFAMVGGFLRCYRVPVRWDLYRALEDAAGEFLEHCKNGTEPLIGNGKAAADYLKRKFPTNGRVDLVEASGELERLCWSLRDLEISIKSAELEAQGVRNQIKDTIRDASGVVGPFGKIYWKQNRSSAATDYKAAFLELVDRVGWSELGINPAEIVARHTTDKPGARPFRPYWEKDS